MGEDTEIENKRKKEIQEHKETLKKTIGNLDKSKISAQDIVEKGKEICQSIDKTKDNVEKEFKIVSTLPKVIPYVNEEQWDEYSRLRQRSGAMAGSAAVLAEDMARSRDQFTTIVTTAGSFESGTASVATSVANTFSSINQNSFQAKLNEIKIEDTTSKNIDFITNELLTIKARIVKDFVSVMKDWSGTGDADLKYKSLLNLRSVFFYQLLDDKCPDSQYSRTAWFQQGLKKRLCQIKFFILGFNDLQSIPSSTLMQINNLSQDFQGYFDNMSEYGKNAERSIVVENVFKEILSSFSEVLRLRKQFYKPSV